MTLGAKGQCERLDAKQIEPLSDCDLLDID